VSKLEANYRKKEGNHGEAELQYKILLSQYGYFAKMLNQRSKAHKKESAYCDQEDRFFSFLIIL